MAMLLAMIVDYWGVGLRHMFLTNILISVLPYVFLAGPEYSSRALDTEVESPPPPSRVT